MPRDEESPADALRGLKIADPTGTVYGPRIAPNTGNFELVSQEHIYDVPGDGDCFFYCVLRSVKAWKDSADPLKRDAYRTMKGRVDSHADRYGLEAPEFAYASPPSEIETNGEERTDVVRLRLLTGAHIGHNFPSFYEDSKEFGTVMRDRYTDLLKWDWRWDDRLPSTNAQKAARNETERKIRKDLDLLRGIYGMASTSDHVKDGLARAVEMGERYLRCKRHTTNADRFRKCIKACLESLRTFYNANNGANRENETRNAAMVSVRTVGEWSSDSLLAVMADILGIYIDCFLTQTGWESSSHITTFGPLPQTMNDLVNNRAYGPLGGLPKFCALRSNNHFRYQLPLQFVLAPNDIQQHENEGMDPDDLDAIAKYYRNGSPPGAYSYAEDYNGWTNPDACGQELDGLSSEADDGGDVGGGGGDVGGGGGDGDGGGGGGDGDGDGDGDGEIYQPGNFVAGTMRFRDFYAEDHICALGELTETQIAYGKARLRKAHESFMVHMATRHGYGQILLMSELASDKASALPTSQRNDPSSRAASDNKKNMEALETIDPKQPEIDVALNNWIKQAPTVQLKDEVRRGYQLAVRIILHYDKLRKEELGAWRAFLYLYGHESNLLSFKNENKLKFTKQEVAAKWKLVIQQVTKSDTDLDRKEVRLSKFMFELAFHFETNVLEALSDAEAKASGALKTVSALLKSPQTGR